MCLLNCSEKKKTKKKDAIQTISKFKNIQSIESECR